ncbi:MAG TPA: DUF4424 family protein [Alphaproteobacteria bacterium]|nr:DUF4424 family protein [Alphaproteobacteria bacterium]
MRIFLIFLIMICGIQNVRANDTAGAVGAGGVVFLKTPGIIMEQEDLFISSDHIKVSYIFKNNTTKDKTIDVFFPIPMQPNLSAQISWDEEVQEEIKRQENRNYSSHNQNQQRDEAPFSNFSVIVNGKPVPFKTENRALKDGKDITAVFQKNALPLSPILASCSYPMEREEENKKCGERIELYKKLGLMTPEGQPLWQKQVNYHWTQTFPAGKEVKIEHSYRPARGFIFFVPNNTRPPEEVLIQQLIPSGAWLSQSYPDRPFGGKSDLISWLIQQFRRASSSTNPSHGMIWIYEVDYILSTGANWEGPIKNFTLTIEYPKGGIVSSGWPIDREKVKAINSNQLQLHQKNFKPEGDLKIFFGIPYH